MKFFIFYFYFCVVSFSLANELRLTLENDILFSKDDNYTHGTSISYSWLPQKDRQHFIFDQPVSYYKFSLSQNLYTPSDLSNSNIIYYDRPYAGTLYVNHSTYMESFNRMRSLDVLIGFLGPSTQADSTQIFVHKAIGATNPEGWNNQLRDEFLLNFLYVDRHRLLKNNYSDFLLNYGFALGNLTSYASLNSTFKLGYNVPNTYGIFKFEPIPSTMQIYKKDNMSFFFFVSGDIKSVFNNVLLDGNTFVSSHSVEKENFVAEFLLGCSLNYSKIEITITSTWRSKEFKEQNKPVNFSGLTIAYSF